VSGLSVLWYHCDLRVHDHAALRAACQDAERDGGQVMALYVQPGALTQGDRPETLDAAFVMDALLDLRRALEQRDAVLHLRQGAILDVLSELHAQHRVISVHHHYDGPAQEDLRKIEAWSLRAGVRLNLHKQFSPVRAARDRTPDQTLWEQFMARPRHEAPDSIPSANVGVGQWSSLPERTREKDGASMGGRKAAIGRLRAFLGAAASETPERQSAKSAFKDLQPHIRLGTVSLREVWQAAIGAHQQTLKSGLDIRAASIATFLHALPEISEAHAGASRRLPDRSRNRKRPGDQLSLELG